MSLNLLGKRKFSVIEPHEYGILLYSVISCKECHNSLIVRRYPDGTYAPICSVERHCKRCKLYVNCLNKQCPVCCLPESGEPVPSFSELVSAGVMRVKILDLPVSFSAEPCTATVVAGSSSSEPGPASVEPCTAMVVAGSASNEPGPASVESGSASVEPCTAMVVAGSRSGDGGVPMLGVRTSSRQGRGKHHCIGFDRQGFFKMVDIYNKFSSRVCEKLFGDDSAVDGAAGGSSSAVSKFTVQELHKLKTEYDKGAAWTTDEVQELCALPLIMLKAQWKDEHQLSTFREQLTKLMVHISELQKATGKHDQEIAALRQAIAELKQAEAGSSVVAACPAPVMYGSAGVGEGFCRISPNDTYIAAGVVPGTFMIVTNGTARIFQSTGYNRTVLDEARRAHTNSTFKGYTREDYRDMDGLPMIIRKLVWGLQAAHRESLKDRNESRDRIKGAEDRLKKLETGHGLTRDELRTVKGNFLVNKKLNEEERKAWDNLPVVLQKSFWAITHDAEALKDEFSSFKRALAVPAGISVASLDLRLKAVEAAGASAAGLDARLKVVEAAGASAAGLDARLKKLEAGPGYTRDEIEKLRKEYKTSDPITEEERAQWDQQPVILRKFQWRVSHNNVFLMQRVTKLEQSTAALKQENAELKQALAAEQQATASQAQEIAALKQTLATQGQAVQSMDAHTAQIMQAVQAMMGPMHGELVELRRRVALLEAARPAGACVAVKQIKKEPKEAA